MRTPIWKQPDGKPVSCVEKIKILNQNLAEIQQSTQDAFEDALLMGCDENQIIEVLLNIVKEIKNPYKEKK